MDKKKLTIIICVAILFVVLVGIVVALNRDNAKTDNKGKQELSVEQSEDEEQGLQDAGTLEDSSSSEDDATTNNNVNSGNFSEFFPEKNSGSTTTEDELNGEQGTQEEEEKETSSPDTDLEESETTEDKYGEIIRP